MTKAIRKKAKAKSQMIHNKAINKKVQLQSRQPKLNNHMKTTEIKRKRVVGLRYFRKK